MATASDGAGFVGCRTSDALAAKVSPPAERISADQCVAQHGKHDFVDIGRLNGVLYACGYHGVCRRCGFEYRM